MQPFAVDCRDIVDARLQGLWYFIDARRDDIFVVGVDIDQVLVFVGDRALGLMEERLY